jgi:trimeric autotransporter adhesin
VLGKRLAVLLWLIAVCGISLAAQQTPDTTAPAELRLTGVVRTPEGTLVPGATLRIIQASTGKAWVSWTDENGKFELPSLPSGHFRIEISQLGFAPATKEVDFTLDSNAPLELKLDVATLAALAAPPATKESAANSSAASPANDAQKNSAPNASADATSGTSSGPRRGRNGVPPPAGGERQGRYERPPSAATPGAENGGARQGGGQRSFQQVGLNGNGQDQNPDAMNNTAMATPDQGPLGQSSSSDAFLMSGTVARAAAPDLSVMSYSGPGQNDASQGTPVGQGDQGGGFAGFGGGGAPGGGPGGGAAIFIPRGGSGGRGPAPRGGGPQGQGVDALWGAQRVRRQRANSIHYSFYDTVGDSALNARPYSLKETNPTKIPSWSERFGGNMGGPLKIPHVYNGTEKTFFFVNYDLGWSRNPVDQFATVPTDAKRAGNFSDRNAQLYDPTTHASWGNAIPASVALNPAAVSLLTYIPHANLPGLVNNFHLQTQTPAATNRINVNIIHTISPKLHLQVAYNLADGHSHTFNSFPDLESNVDTRGQTVTLALTQNWTKTFIHDSRLLFSRNRYETLNQFAFRTNIAGDLGINSANGGVSTDPIDFGVPQLNFVNFSGAGDPVPSLTRNQTYRYVDTFSILKSKHTIKTGFEIRKIDTNTRKDPLPRGAFTFDGSQTALLDSSGKPLPGTGSDFADFLLGLPQATSERFGASSTYFRSWGYVAYAQDDWHMIPQFTLQYGIRYEATTPPVEMNNRIANLDVSPDFTAAQVVTPGLNGPYSGSIPRSLIRGDYNNVSPRIGIAWQPPGKWFTGRNQTTVRAGYGIFYNGSIYSQLDSAMASQPPFAQAQSRRTSSATPLTFSNAFPPANSSQVSNTVAVNPNYRVGYAQIWNFSVERQLFNNSSLELTYTGTNGTNLDMLFGFSRITGTVQNALGFTYDTSGASSSYHGLQVRVQRRFTKGLMINGTYTYSKSLDDASSIGGDGQVVVQDINNLSAERGLSSFDMRHQFRANYMYELPFGERKRWATKGWEKSLLGNWRFSGSFSAHTGTPYTARVAIGACSIIPGVFSERGNQVGDPNLPAGERTTTQWFNTSAFVLPAGAGGVPACIGDAARNTITGPGLFTWNAALAKTIPFGRDGQRRLDFRVDTTNLLNHVNFSGISTVVNSATFGSVTGAGAMRSLSFTTRVNF